MKSFKYLLLIISLFLICWSASYGQEFTLSNIDLNKPISLEGWTRSEIEIIENEYGTLTEQQTVSSEFLLFQGNKKIILDRETYDSLFVSATCIEKGKYLSDYGDCSVTAKVLKNMERQSNLKELNIEIWSGECLDLLNSFDFSNLKNLHSLKLKAPQGKIKWPLRIHEIKNLTELTIEGNLSNIDANIGEMSQIKNLDIANNNLEQLPPDIAKLKKLESLNISDNQIKSLPAGFDKLTNLLFFDASNNPLNDIPGEFSNPLKMAYLDLSNTLLNNEQLFKMISVMPELISLRLKNSKLKSLNPGLLSKKYLTTLDLANNPIDFSFSDHKLPSLEVLNLSETKTDTVSEDIKKYVNLKMLDLNYTDLIYLDPSIGKLHNLETVNLWGVKVAYPYVRNALREEQVSEYSLQWTYFRTCKDVAPLEVTALHLSLKEISALEDYIHEFKNLQTISIHNQNIQNPKDFVAEFDALSLNTVLADFNNLVEYRYCNFDYELGRINVNLEGIDKIKSLKTLNLTGTKMNEIPDDVLKLENLECLIMRNCGLEVVPDGLNKYKKLTIADFTNVVNRDGYDHFEKNNIGTIPNEYRGLMDSGIIKVDNDASL